MKSGTARGLCATGVVAVLACGQGPPAPAPSAVINAMPTAVCAGDNFMTPIALDAKGSAAHLTLVYVPPPPGSPPLRYHWAFSGSATMVTAGDVNSDSVTVTMAGDRPLHVALTVSNSEGGSTTTTTTIDITPLDSSGNCPLAPVSGP